MADAEPKPKIRGNYFPHFKRSPHKKRPIQLVARDYEIIKSIHLDRLQVFSFLAKLFPPDEEARRRRALGDPHDQKHTNLYRRLEKLFDNRYLARLSNYRGGEHIYALDHRGADLLRERDGLSISTSLNWQEKNRSLSPGYVDHTLMQSCVRMALTIALKSHPTLTLDHYERENDDLMAELTQESKRIYVKPDGLFRLLDEARPVGNNRLGFLHEADNSTMDHGRMLAKYIRYSMLYTFGAFREQFGMERLRVLTTTKTLARAQNLVQAIGDPSSPIPKEHLPLYYFTTQEFFEKSPENFLAACWYRADTPYDLRAIVSSPLPYR